MKLADKDILRLARINPRKAFRLAFGQYWEVLYRHACRKVDSAETAKDLVQEVFMVCWDNLEKLAAQDRLEPYLYAVLRNKILKLFEKDEVRLRYAMQYTKPSEALEDNPQQQLLTKELQHILEEEIGALPERMRQIYQLRHEDGLSIREIAQQLHLSEQTVKNQLHTATIRLRDRFTDYGLSLIMAGIALLFR